MALIRLRMLRTVPYGGFNGNNRITKIGYNYFEPFQRRPILNAWTHRDFRSNSIIHLDVESLRVFQWCCLHCLLLVYWEKWCRARKLTSIQHLAELDANLLQLPAFGEPERFLRMQPVFNVVPVKYLNVCAFSSWWHSQSTLHSSWKRLP